MKSITIANLALMALGIPPITDFDDPSKYGKQCKAFFPVLVDRVLRDHHWSFAFRHCDLAELNIDTPDRRWRYVCALPVDLIRVVRLESRRAYRMFGGNILVDALPARLFYTARITNSEEFDPLFCEALQYLLAAELALANTRDGNMAERFRREYEMRLMTARSVDSAENIHDMQRQPRQSSFHAARRGARGAFDHTGEPAIFTEGDAGVQP